jgi:hypothetical protein
MAFLLYARSLATCKQGLVALAPHIEMLKLSVPCVVGHLLGIIHTIPLGLGIIAV